MKKILISLVIGFFSVINCHAQNESADIGEQIFGFISRLNRNIDSFFLKEKAERAYRLVGYFKNDLSAYVKTRESLLTNLKNWDFKSENNQLKGLLSVLQSKIEKLKERVRALKPVINDDLNDEADGIIDMIDGKVAVQQVYISKLQQILLGYRKEGVKKEMVSEGEAIHKYLSESVTVAGKIRQKLKVKFNLS